MDDHPRVLQKRIQAASVGRRLRQQFERALFNENGQKHGLDNVDEDHPVVLELFR
jgi:hypothetical protein